MNALGWATVGVAAVPAVPLVTLGVQGLLAQLPLRGVRRGERGRVSVLIPAHNEAAMLGETLDAIVPQLRLDAGDRCVVVADNCTDYTAALARGRGVEVVERSHATDRGKGFALAAGMAALAGEEAASDESPEESPDVVVIVDADCDVRDGAIDALATAASGTGRPVQALYLMDVPGDAGVGRWSQVLRFW